MNRRTKLMIAKYALYVLLMVILYVRRPTQPLCHLPGSSRCWCCPLRCALPCLIPSWPAGCSDCWQAFLCDTSSNVLFGFQSILYLLICTAVGLLVVYFMQPSVTNSLIFVGCGFAGRLLLEYFFYYAMWGYDNAYLILLQRMLPNLLYTLALTPLWFLLVRRLHRFFQEKLE